MKPSMYVERFKQMKADGTGPQLIGDVLLVEQIGFEERRTKSGLILDAPAARPQVNGINNDKPHFVRVLAVGEGFYDDETKEDVPLNVTVGDIVLVGQMSVRYFSQFADLDPYKPDSIGVTRESEILFRFKEGDKGYSAAFDSLNRASKEEMEGQQLSLKL